MLGIRCGELGLACLGLSGAVCCLLLAQFLFSLFFSASSIIPGAFQELVDELRQLVCVAPDDSEEIGRLVANGPSMSVSGVRSS